MISCPSCALTHTPAEWLELPWAGETKNENGDIEELRACSCGRILYVTVKPGLTLIKTALAVVVAVAVAGGLMAWAT